MGPRSVGWLACAWIVASGCAAAPPARDAGPPAEDAGSVRDAPPPTADCAPDFPAPSVEPVDWSAEVQHAGTGERVVGGSTLEVMLDAEGRRVVPLSTTVDRSGFSCWKISSEIVDRGGATVVTPAYQALSDGTGAPMIWHVRVGDLTDEEVTLTFHVQGNSTEYFRWTRTVRVGPG